MDYVIDDIHHVKDTGDEDICGYEHSLYARCLKKSNWNLAACKGFEARLTVCMQRAKNEARHKLQQERMDRKLAKRQWHKMMYKLGPKKLLK